ncbi:hypothetical protein ACTA71_010518 [Dictyostelium dimigraforme]
MVYYDLNVDSSLSEPKIKAMLSLHTKYGYDSVAITHTVEGKIGYKDVCKIKKVNIEDESEKSTSSGWMRMGDSNKTIKQYTRLQVICKTMAEFQMITANNPVIQSYDIISVVPYDVSVFNAACNSNEIDIITIDTFSKFIIKPERVRQCIGKGIFIEILYGNLFGMDADRVAFFQIASSLVRSSFGKNIILSSSGKSSTTLRSPYDLSNLGHLFGLTFDQAKAAVSKHPHSAVLHAITRRTKGIATVTDPNLLKDLELWKLERKEDTQPTNNNIPHEKHINKEFDKDSRVEKETTPKQTTIKSTTTTTTTTASASTKTKTQPTTPPTTEKNTPSLPNQPQKSITVKTNKKPPTTTEKNTIQKQTKMDIDDNNKRKRE